MNNVYTSGLTELLYKVNPTSSRVNLVRSKESTSVKMHYAFYYWKHVVYYPQGACNHVTSYFLSALTGLILG